MNFPQLMQLNPIQMEVPGDCLWCRRESLRSKRTDQRVTDIFSDVQKFRSSMHECSFVEPRNIDAASEKFRQFAGTSDMTGHHVSELLPKCGYFLLVVTLMAGLVQSRDWPEPQQEEPIESRCHRIHSGGLTEAEVILMKSLLPIDADFMVYHPSSHSSTFEMPNSHNFIGRIRSHSSSAI